MKLRLQYFGGRGSGGGKASGGALPQNSISETSTGGKIVQQSSDQWYGENDNGYYVVINDTGKSDINMAKYGSRQIYEVDRGIPIDSKNIGATNPQRLYATTKSEAMQYAKGWLKNNK